MRRKLLQDRYFIPGETDERQIYIRVAGAISPDDPERLRQIRGAMEEFRWLPNCVSKTTRVDNTCITNIKPTDTISSGQVLQTFDHRIKPGYKITTSYGYTIIASSDHQFQLAIDGQLEFVSLHAMSVGDIVTLQRNFASQTAMVELVSVPKLRPSSNQVTLPVVLDVAVAEFLGLWYGDGSYSQNTAQIAVDEQDVDLIHHIQDLMEDIFGTSSTVNHITDTNGGTVTINSRRVVSWLQANGFVTHRSSIPECILTSNRDTICAFLRGLFEADGSAYSRVVEYTTKHELVARQVQQLLLSVGIPSYVRMYKGFWRVAIHSGESKLQYLQSVGFLSARKSKLLDHLVKNSRGGIRILGCRQSLATWYQVHKNYGLYTRLADCFTNKRDITEHRLCKVAVEYPELESCTPYIWMQQGIFTDTIISIEEVGNVDMADIQTSSTWYVADGFRTHNSPTLVNAGRPGTGGLSACYVLPINDSLDGIYKTVWDAARVHKSFGGTGFNFSQLREAGAPIISTGGKACGPIKVMELLNQSAGTVMQGGKREGANMGILNDDHPDIHKFIQCKDSGSNLSHFNISVGIHDATMRADDDILTQVAEHAWKTGDPGIIFLDRLNEGNRHANGVNGVPVLDPIECTNPCGEVPLRSYESCNLGSINLAKYADMVDGDYAAFQDMVDLSVTTLDRIIDINVFPIPEIREATLATRKVGSGIMGWADWLILGGISYQSSEAIRWIDKIGGTYQMCARNTSHNLALEYGNYPAWGDSPHAEMRNEVVMSIAPTGTLSYLAGCSWGIEPVFDWDYQRDSESGSQVLTSSVYQAAKASGLLGDTAKLISPEWQVNHLAAWQKWVDNGVSKTINLPTSATVEDIIKVFRQAWQMKCKGITVYRDGSKQKQAIRSTRPEGEQGGVKPIPPPRKGPADPAVRDGHNVERFGSTIDFRTGCGRIHVTCNERDKDSGVPFEVYILSDGGCPANNEAIGKLISKYLHDDRLSGCELETAERIIKTLRKVECPTAMQNKNSQGKSCAEIIAKRILQVWGKRAVPGERPPSPNLPDKMVEADGQTRCPQCGEPATFGLGCRNGSCKSCGWSGCT